MHTSSAHPAPAHEVRRWTIAAGLIALIVCVYRFVAPANTATVAMTLLLLVLALARWGLKYAVVTSLVATVCYNFFFLPPVGTFTIADPQNWLALFAFLVTSVIGSRLAEQARRDAAEARVRQKELEILYRLSRELLQAEDVQSLLGGICPAVQKVTASRSVALQTTDGQFFRSSGPVAMPLAYQGSGLTANVPERPHWLNSEEVVVPLHVGVRPRGVLMLAGSGLSDETLDALGGLVSVSMDRAQALEEVTRTRTAQESERMRKIMMDAVTHELRTPLTAIKAASTTLLSAATLPEEDRQELVAVIDEEADRLNRLVARAVEVTQLETRDAQMVFARVAAGAIAREALEESAAALGRHVVETDIPSTVPEVFGDAAYLAKVLSNLLENAAKYSRAGTTIMLRAAQHGDSLVFAVEDRGVGIDASETALIFDRLYRAKTQSEIVPGSGMGLAISRSIAAAHGGTLEVESTPGVGSTFRLTLPLTPAEQQHV